MEEKIILRYGAPSNLDHAPYGTQCRVGIGKNDFDLYLQVNKHSDEDPHWELVGNFPTSIDPEEIKRIINTK